MLSSEKAFELIERRRRQMHVHSVIYYYLDSNIITDATFDKWAVELAALQRDFPQFKHKGYAHQAFINWTGDTGMHLPVTEDALSIAQGLLRTAQNRMAPVGKIQRPGPMKASGKMSEAKWEGDVGYEKN